MIIKKPTKEQVDEIDLNIYYDLVEKSTHKDYFLNVAGQEHYKLLAYVSKQHKKGATLIDFGTYKGLSARALSYNPDVKVVSYDISRGNIEEQLIDADNIEFKCMSGLDDIEFASKADWIFLDIDPHDGAKELSFIKALEDAGYKGQILCDDIHLNDAMKPMWANLEYKKEDWTDIGHYTGSGMIYID